METLSILAGRLELLDTHDALQILRHSISLPSLQHLLRAIFCHNHPQLKRFDDALRTSLAAILNVNVSDDVWAQASLPIRYGGLGMRRVNQVAPSAYLSASHRCEELITSLLQGAGCGFFDSSRVDAKVGWGPEGGVTEPCGEELKVQKAWDTVVVKKTADNLLNSASDGITAARLRASFSPHAGDWLNAPPLTAAGLRMSNEVVRIAAGLRLGTQLCGQHVCPCGETVEVSGVHGLSCRFNSGRLSRHTTVNDLLYHALNRAGFASVKEPQGLITGSSLRPDGVTLVPWARGKCMAWDFTSPDTLANSHLQFTSTVPGSAAERAARGKEQKYTSLQTSHIFIPVAIESLGSWNAEGEQLVKDLGRRLTAVTGEPRETSFLFQRISIAVQRGNAAAVLGTLPQQNSSVLL